MKMYRISEENAGELRETMKKVKDVKAYRQLEAAALRGGRKKKRRST